MTVINVVVESTLNGPTSGYQGIAIDDSHVVGDLIRRYCNAKVITIIYFYITAS